MSIGQAIEDLALLTECSKPEDLNNVIAFVRTLSGSQAH